MLKSHYRPRLDTLEERVPPSDALFSLLWTTLAQTDLGTGADRVALGSPDHCGNEQATEQALAFLGTPATAANPSLPDSATLGTPVATTGQVQENTLTVAVMQSIGGGPSIQTITVNFGVLPESSLVIPRLTGRFGADPPEYGLDVDIDKETGAAVVPADRLNLAFSFSFSGIRININSIALEDGVGYYDFNTGDGELSINIGFHATSDELPGFDNEHCILGPLAVTLSTFNEGAVAFSGGDGTMVANTFAVPALKRGMCGSGPFGDYALIFNDVAGLPVAKGEGVLTLNLRQDPPQLP